MKIGMAYFEFGGSKGVARTAAELTTRMAALGHEVHFHCTRIPERASGAGIHFHAVPAINSFNALGLFSFAWLAKKSLSQCHYDITHSHGNVIGSDVITAHSCHKAGLELLRASSGSSKPHSHIGVADKIRLFLEKKNYGERRFKRIIAVSQGVKRELIDHYGLSDSDISVVPNGVDLLKFNPSVRDTAGKMLREKLGIARDEFVLVFVANEFERKGLNLAIAALSILKRRDVKLLVVGSDKQQNYRQQAERLGIEKQILFMGSVTSVSDYYAASDAFVLPTFYEAFSLATLEAAASGLPLLATKVNGTEELIVEGYNGFFMERNAESVAEKIRLLLKDRSLSTKLGTHARQSAEGFSWDIITQKTLEVYSKVQ